LRNIELISLKELKLRVWDY